MKGQSQMDNSEKLETRYTKLIQTKQTRTQYTIHWTPLNAKINNVNKT